MIVENLSFTENKSQFFSKLNFAESENASLRVIEQQINQVDYSFLLQNKNLLETEFEGMLHALEEQFASEQMLSNKKLWFYSYYCASLLEVFYRGYEQQDKAANYEKLKDKIKKTLLNEQISESSTKANSSFTRYLYSSLKEGIGEILSIPFHLSKLRTNVVYANIWRINWVFTRLTLTQGLSLASELHLIEQFDALFGTHTDVDKIIAHIKAPTGIVNYFSVGLFLARFVIDAGLLLKHTFFPTKEEEKGSTRYQRFVYELDKRHCNLINDLTWATINFLTNFNYISGLSDPTCGYLIAGFLIFDIGMISYKYLRGRREFLDQKDQYDINKLTNPEMAEKIWSQQQQNWKIKQASFAFNAMAAVLFFTGFSAALVLANPVLITACFFACIFAAAMYLTGDKYEAYKKEQIILNAAPADEKQQQQFKQARSAFVLTLAKNTLAPLVFVAVYSVSLPAALALTVAYWGGSLLLGYQKEEGNNSPSGSGSAVSKTTIKSVESNSDNTLEFDSPTTVLHG